MHNPFYRCFGILGDLERWEIAKSTVVSVCVCDGGDSCKIHIAHGTYIDWDALQQHGHTQIRSLSIPNIRTNKYKNKSV